MEDTGQPGATDSQDAIFVDAQGNVGLSTSKPAARLDVSGDASVSGTVTATQTVTAKGFLGDGTGLTVNGPATLQAALDAKFDKAGGTVSGALTVAGGLTVGAVAAPGTAPVQFSSPVVAPNVQSTNLNQYSMYPMTGAVIYQDIFAAKSAGAIVKFGSPSYDDTSYPSSNPWNHRTIIKYGSNSEQDGNGALVTIPAGFDTIWIRVLGDRWNVVHAYALDRRPAISASGWAGTARATRTALTDRSATARIRRTNGSLSTWASAAGWLSFPSPIPTQEFWVSGLAFTKNPWAHAAQSAVAFVWGLNGGDTINWEGVWGSDVDCSVSPQTMKMLKVPFVNSGRDKLLYVIGENNDPNRLAHDGVWLNGTNIGRLRASFDNPFARHWNSKMYERYAAVFVPANLTVASGFWECADRHGASERELQIPRDRHPRS